MQFAFSFDAPVIAGELAVTGVDAVAGNGEGDAICGAGAGNGADCGRLSELRGDLEVGARFALRDLLQSVPDFLLEGGAAQV